MATTIHRLKPRLGTVGSAIPTITPGSWRTPDHNASSTKRGYGYKWQKAREGHLLSEPLCRMCKELDRRAVPATVVDHITPHRGDQAIFWDRNNWRSLCKHHHDSESQKKDNALAKAIEPR